MMATDSTDTFMVKLAQVQHHFIWIVCLKTGHITGWHREYDDPFTPMEAVAWGETGLRYVDGDYEAARDPKVGMQGISHVVYEASRQRNNDPMRKAILKAIHMEEPKRK